MRLSRRRSTRRWITASLVVALTAWGAGFFIFLSILPTAVARPDAPTDAIVVLTGGSMRLDVGLKLLERGQARKLFVSGVHRGVDVAELLRVTRMDPSRAECCIALGYQADDTVGNARETAEWMALEGFRSLRLVTAAYHMPRSLIEFRAAMPGIEILPNPVFPDHVKSMEWYRYPGTAALIAGEYMKTVLAFIRRSALSAIPR